MQRLSAIRLQFPSSPVTQYSTVPSDHTGRSDSRSINHVTGTAIVRRHRVPIDPVSALSDHNDDGGGDGGRVGTVTVASGFQSSANCANRKQSFFG